MTNFFQCSQNFAVGSMFGFFMDTVWILGTHGQASSPFYAHIKFDSRFRIRLWNGKVNPKFDIKYVTKSVIRFDNSRKPTI